MPQKELFLDDDPLWYKDAIIYEVHVKTFYDSSGDGSGDFKGLTEKLDYLQSLGITAIWLLPFYPSPLRDGGYDISDYHGVHPRYGTLTDFRAFLKEAHKRGLRVITELVLNHTSDQHAWFRRARKADRGSEWRDYYVWNDTPDKYKDARIIFKDFETSNWTWDSIAKAYYWHRFYYHQPELNYDNPRVQREILKVVGYWFDMGVDGLRLDALPYLFEREGTSCENLPETFEYLKKLRAHIDAKFRNKMILAEANQWPEDAAAYFGNGDQCHMAFHFPLMPRIFMAARMEDRFPIIDIFDQTPPTPESCQWALFLRNHDELTLEMVSDEERDYMYRFYAKDPIARINLGIRRRLAPLLSNSRRRIELMNILLLSLPGTPVIYYGDEIGMGDNHYLGDRDGVRTPMQWNGDRNAGFSHGNPQQLYLPIIIDPEYHYEAVNVENQERNQSSLLWWMRRAIATRKRFKAFGRGTIEFLQCENPRVLAFIRQYQDETILVVVNLSRFSQVVELDLSRFAGYVPEEVVSRNMFPLIKDSSYVLTLGFHDYYWFLLRKEEEIARFEKRRVIPELSLSGSWDSVFEGTLKEKMEREIIPSFLERCHWLGNKAGKIQLVKIIERLPLGSNASYHQFLFLEVRYREGTPETYLFPLSFSSGSVEPLKDSPHAVIARIKVDNVEGVLYDGAYDEGFRKNVLGLMARKQSVKGLHGQLTAYLGKFLRNINKGSIPLEKSKVLNAEKRNTSFLYDNQVYFKVNRYLEDGPSPDLELGRFLSENTSFSNLPPFAGAIEYKKAGSEPVTLGILQAFVPNEGVAWRFTLDALGMYYERVLSRKGDIQEIPKAPYRVSTGASQEIPELLQEVIGGDFLEMTSLLGRRTAEMHLALSSELENPNFAPEPFSLLYQRSVYQSMQSLAKRVFDLLRKTTKKMPAEPREKANQLLGMEKQVMTLFREFIRKKIDAAKIRIHGNYHLGQVLYTGNDFFIIDFGGETTRDFTERRMKSSPIRDVAGMVLSFHYAAYTSLHKRLPLTPVAIRELDPWADLWYRYVREEFIKSYLRKARNALFLPKNDEDFNVMLRSFLLETAFHELRYELTRHPDRTVVPMRGILHLLEE